eukprot:Anaeramoba_flamelloidesa594364_6.p1 GENE.a594364_6~~a594364_6.p1  ORF type:complete len:138 (-),score=24.94 a594364_6:22-435(-)
MNNSRDDTIKDSVVKFLNNIMFVSEIPDIVLISQRALKINPECNVALMYLGDQSPKPHQAITYYDKLVNLNKEKLKVHFSVSNKQMLSTSFAIRSYLQSKFIHSFCNNCLTSYFLILSSFFFLQSKKQQTKHKKKFF